MLGQVDGGTLDALFLGPQGGYDAQQDGVKIQGASIPVEFGNMYAREIASFSNSLPLLPTTYCIKSMQWTPMSIMAPPPPLALLCRQEPGMSGNQQVNWA